MNIDNRIQLYEALHYKLTRLLRDGFRIKAVEKLRLAGERFEVIEQQARVEQETTQTVFSITDFNDGVLLRYTFFMLREGSDLQTDLLSQECLTMVEAFIMDLKATVGYAGQG